MIERLFNVRLLALFSGHYLSALIEAEHFPVRRTRSSLWLVTRELHARRCGRIRGTARSSSF